MDRRRWLQHERSERPSNRRLPGGDPRWRDESAQRKIAFLSNEKNGEDQRRLATLHLNCFGLAAAAPGGNGSCCLPPSTAHRYVIVSNGGVGRPNEQRQCHSQKQLPLRWLLAKCPPNSPRRRGAGRRSLCGVGSDSRNHPVLLRALDAARSSALLGRIQ